MKVTNIRQIMAQTSGVDNALVMNQATYNMYLERLIDLAISRFEWENMPETVDKRFLETSLLYHGMVAFFKDDVLGYLALPACTQGQLGVYNIPVKWYAYASNGTIFRDLDETNSVLIWNNNLHSSTVPILQQYAYRLYETQRAIDTNVSLSKYPAIIQCSEEERLTMENLFAKYQGNIPLIFATRKLNLSESKVIDMNVPKIFPDLQIQLKQQWGEALTYLGIENNSINKAERQITDEVVSSLGNVFASRWSATAPREVACDQINSLFDLNVGVKYRSELLQSVHPVVEGGEE